MICCLVSDRIDTQMYPKHTTPQKEDEKAGVLQTLQQYHTSHTREDYKNVPSTWPSQSNEDSEGVGGASGIPYQNHKAIQRTLDQPPANVSDPQKENMKQEVLNATSAHGSSGSAHRNQQEEYAHQDTNSELYQV